MTCLAEQSFTSFVIDKVSDVIPTKTMTLEEMKNTRRLKHIIFSKEFFLHAFRQGKDGVFFKIDEPGIPDDAMIVGFSEHYRFAQDQLMVKIYSSTFDVVKEGCFIPELEVFLRLVEVKEQK